MVFAGAFRQPKNSHDAATMCRPTRSCCRVGRFWCRYTAREQEWIRVQVEWTRRAAAVSTERAPGESIGGPSRFSFLRSRQPLLHSAAFVPHDHSFSISMSDTRQSNQGIGRGAKNATFGTDPVLRTSSVASGEKWEGMNPRSIQLADCSVRSVRTNTFWASR